MGICPFFFVLDLPMRSPMIWREKARECWGMLSNGGAPDFVSASGVQLSLVLGWCGVALWRVWLFLLSGVAAVVVLPSVFGAVCCVACSPGWAVVFWPLFLFFLSVFLFAALLCFVWGFMCFRASV